MSTDMKKRYGRELRGRGARRGKSESGSEHATARTVAVGLALSLVLVLGARVEGTTPTRWSPVPTDRFALVASPSPQRTPTPRFDLWRDFAPKPHPRATPPPIRAGQPHAAPRGPESTGTRHRVSVPPPRRTGRSATGQASWYCLPGRSVCPHGYSGGLYAAAGPPLRIGSWRGRTVTVCRSGCIQAKLVDWCACPHRVIDLFADAFRRVASLDAGVTRVTVRW